MMTRSQRFLKGISFGYLNQAIVAAVNLWAVPFLVKSIQPENYGLWLLCQQFLLYLALADLGVVALLPRETAYMTGRSSGSHSPDIQEPLWDGFRFLLCQLPFLSIVCVGIYSYLVSRHEGISSEVVFLLASFVLLYPFRAFPAVLQGLQDFVFLGFAQTLAWALGLAFTVYLTLMGRGLMGLIAGWVLQNFLLSLFCLLRTVWLEPHLFFSPNFSGSWKRTKAMLEKSKWVLVSQLGQMLMGGTDLVIIGQMMGPTAVVAYNCTAKLINFLCNQPQVLTEMAAPALSEMRISESNERMANTTSAISQLVLIFSGAIACFILVANKHFVVLWIGQEYYLGTTLTVFLTLNMLLRHWSTTMIYSIFCFGSERFIALMSLMDGLVSFVATILLVRKYGVIGAPLGAIVGVVLVALPLNLWVLGIHLRRSVATLVAHIQSWAIRFLPAAVLSTALGWYTPVSSLGCLLAIVGVALLLYGLVMLSFCLKSALTPYFRACFPLSKWPAQ